MTLIELADKCNVVPRGVIHVGAHEAQEAKDYEGLEQLYIEPIPELVQSMRDRGLDVIEVALSDHTGTEDFYVTSFNQGSSLLQPLEHEVASKITVKVDTLKNVVPYLDPFNCLVIDVQGAELAVLKGADLEAFDLIVCETNSRKRYANAPLHDDIVEYMETKGFVLAIVISHSSDQVINDCVFIKG